MRPIATGPAPRQGRSHTDGVTPLIQGMRGQCRGCLAAARPRDFQVNIIRAFFAATSGTLRWHMFCIVFRELTRTGRLPRSVTIAT